MTNTVLVANRGEIACRILRTAKAMGLRTVTVHSEAERFAPWVREADASVLLGPAPVAESYLQADRIVAACREHGVDLVHPGYGFLSENAGFAEKLAAADTAFAGPTPDQLRMFGLKHEARAAAERAGVPLAPGTGLLADIDSARAAAEHIGYPVMLKSTAGGGGIGLRICRDPEELAGAFDAVKRLGVGNFGDDGVFLEKFVETARHVEVQIFGDGRGKVIALGERDCSLQRRNQKLVEEAPAPCLPEATRTALHEAAVRLGESVAYRSAGTVEFLYDVGADRFYFLEVNTRLQVEHGVTEALFGVDLVGWMLRLALDPDFELPAIGAPQGHAIEVRVNAEDAARDFRPQTGTLTRVVLPDAIRVDGWIEGGAEITPYYDNLLAKLIAHGPGRDAAIDTLADALETTAIDGLETNLPYHRAILATEWFRAGDVSTARLATFRPEMPLIDVVAGGALTTVQAWPGRTDYWQVGVPPSGPMDDLSFRLANRVLGNPEGTPALECTLQGPTLRFLCAARIALGGADMGAKLEGRPVPLWEPVDVAAGETLSLGRIEGAGHRAYVAIAGGLAVPFYLGSGATFTLGKFGGHATGPVKTGDALRIGSAAHEDAAPLPEALRPALTHEWEIGVLYGPHGAPDFFREEDIETLFSADYEVHFNSARTGVRLIGPKPKWAREDGGEAGLHPSNLHDNAYAVGALDFTGDMPVILGPDGPSLGGFVCPVTVALSEMWKVGQLSPGDRLRFVPISDAEARAAWDRQATALKSLEAPAAPAVLTPADTGSPILRRGEAQGTEIVYRRSGEDNILVEFGPNMIDFGLRFQAHELMQWLERENISGLGNLTPGIRSLQVNFDPAEIGAAQVLDRLAAAERELPPVDDIEVASRIVHLPLSWDDPSTREAIHKYQSGVNPDAPWCPSNIEFIRRINGLADEQAVKDVVFGASYMVMGLGDVYLGAPVAVPVDPRHRLVTTKYNPARTWTPENAVGIGGAYLCIYGMEGPGGYQFVGRTVQVWNTWRTTPPFAQGKPWLLRFFDRIRFHPVSHEELTEARAAFLHGGYPIRIEEDVFRLADYRAFETENAREIADFQAKRAAAFAEERARWEAAGLNVVSAEEVATGGDLAELPEGTLGAEAPLAGSVWKLLAEPGAAVEAGETVALIESMKMEVEVTTPVAGTVQSVLAKEGETVGAGQAILAITPEETA